MTGDAMNATLLGDALFTTTQQKVLALLFGKPDQSFYANEIVRLAGAGKGGVMRELERLHGAGALTLVRQGNQTRYQANPKCPIYAELVAIVHKTFGVAVPIRRALQPLAAQIVWAFVYGSLAKSEDHAASDIDLMLVGDGLSYGAVMELLLPLEERLGRPLNPALYTPQDLLTKHAAGNSFVRRVLDQPKIPVMGHNPLETNDSQ